MKPKSIVFKNDRFENERFFKTIFIKNNENENWSLQIESRRAGVYKQKVELELTDRKQENWCLQLEC